MTEYPLAGHFLKFAVLGYPIKHSKSPKIFNFLKDYFEFTNSSSDFSYDFLEIAPEDFLKSTEILKQYDGLNVTSPYKEKVLELSMLKFSKVSPEVEILKAANVLKKSKDKFEAHNTDVYAFKESLENHHVTEMSALVLGSSGGAKAAILGLYQMGIKDIFVKARDYSGFKKFDIPIQAYRDQKPNIVVQATTLGLANTSSNTSSNTSQGEKDLDFFNIDYSNTKISYDLIYSPKKTPFMEISLKNKVPHVMNGESMLALQALKTFEIWFGHQGSKTSNVLEKLKEIL